MRYLILLTLFIISLNAKDYNTNKKTKEFITMMETKHNYKRSYLQKLFSDVEVQKIPLHIYSKPKESKEIKYIKYGDWDHYEKNKVSIQRINAGINFLNKYKTTFKKVEEVYGVEAEYVAAIIGIESVYGKNMGNFPVFDTLTTLAFEKNRRNKFFTNQLKEFIRLSYKHKINPKSIKGSYAGAIGLGQFIPSSYKYFGVDFNKDGKVSLQNPVDAIASVANYLKKNGWEKNEVVATRVSYDGIRFDKYKTGYHIKYDRKDLKGIKPKYGQWGSEKVRLIKLSRKKYDELWYGAKNFYVITRYNQSSYYAMSVHMLAQSIKKKIKS